MIERGFENPDRNNMKHEGKFKLFRSLTLRYLRVSIHDSVTGQKCISLILKSYELYLHLVSHFQVLRIYIELIFKKELLEKEEWSYNTNIIL